MLVASVASHGGEINRLETDTLRGLAMLAVLFHHAVLWSWGPLELYPEANRQFFRLAESLSTLLQPVRMPLFTILSAWIYSGRPVTATTVKPFIAAKIRRILLPLIFASTVSYFLEYWLDPDLPKIFGVERGPAEFWKFWFVYFGHLWFLQALFTIFILMVVIDRLEWMNSIRSWGIWLAVLTVLPEVTPNTTVWSLGKTAELAVFFFFGVGLRRFANELGRPGTTRVAWAIFSFALTYCAVAQFGISELPALRLPEVLAGTTGAMCLMSIKLRVPLLALLGGYSFTIYLYQNLGLYLHLFYDGLLGRGVGGQVLWMSLSIALAVAVPIILHKVAKDVPTVRTFMLGLRPVTS